VALTLVELKDRIGHTYDVVALCDLFEITEEELLDRFEDRLLEFQDHFEEELIGNEGGYYVNEEETE